MALWLYSGAGSASVPRRSLAIEAQRVVFPLDDALIDAAAAIPRTITTTSHLPDG
jgi:hypothetical protein